MEDFNEIKNSFDFNEDDKFAKLGQSIKKITYARSI